MAEPHNVFISWSGPRSRAAAEALAEWLPMIIQAAKPWMSASDIDKGTRWREEISGALDSMKAGIICVTPENRNAEWLLFESGALSKSPDPKTRAWTYLLVGLKPTDLKDPLAMFNATTQDKEETRKLLRSINTNLDSPVSESALDKLFDKLWPDLDEKLSHLPPIAQPAPPVRKPEDMIPEILELLRSLASPIQETAAEVKLLKQARIKDTIFRPPTQGERSPLTLSDIATILETTRQAQLVLADTDSPTPDSLVERILSIKSKAALQGAAKKAAQAATQEAAKTDKQKT